jgi:3-hydroxyisobutyrate dehydrogenase-like beta-hydroxyacid dehydrogenase
MADAAWGFVGLGEMGAPMVRNLLAAGREVVVFDTFGDRLAGAVAGGASAAADVAELARRSSVVSVCVRDDRQLDQVLADGLLAAARPGSAVVIHSTIGPASCRAVAARLAERGVDTLDAPVSGMRMAAAHGTLTFFAGGSAEVLDRARPGLLAMGRTIRHVGDVGAGQVVKIANNLVAFTTAGVVEEAVALARAAGVGEATLLEALACGSARSWVVENFPFLRREWQDSQPGGAAAVRDIVAKDLELATGVADEAGVAAPFAALAAEHVPKTLTSQHHESGRD